MDLVQIRRKHGLSQEAVAKAVGISRAAYGNIEIHKRQPSVTTAKRIAEVLGFDWTEFFERNAEERNAV